MSAMMSKNVAMSSNWIVCIIILTLPGMVYSGGNFDADRDYIPIDAVSIYCNREDFLSALGIDANKCSMLIKKYSEECRNIIFPIVPKIDITESKDKTFSIGKSIGYIYILCLKSYIYEDVFGVPNY